MNVDEIQKPPWQCPNCRGMVVITLEEYNTLLLIKDNRDHLQELIRDIQIEREKEELEWLKM